MAAFPVYLGSILPGVIDSHSSPVLLSFLGLLQAPGDLAPCWGTGKQEGLGGWGVGDGQEVQPVKLRPHLGRVKRYRGRE